MDPTAPQPEPPPEDFDRTRAVDPQASAADPVPRRVGRFTLEELLGRGGQASVWSAVDPRFPGRPVALKLLHLSLLDSRRVVERFRREARIATALEHPAICPVFDAGVDDGIAWIAMRRVRGRSLADVLREAEEERPEPASFFIDASLAGEDPTADEAFEESAPPSTTRVDRREARRTVGFFEEAARGLHAAHRVGVVHRDIKPGNLMVTDEGRPVILDFGLARDESEDGMTLTSEGDVMGTPVYMSPEQVRGARGVDHRTDVYSLGVSLYEALSGRRPFLGASRSELFEAITYREPQRLRRLNPAIDRDLETIVAKAMEKDPERRYVTAEALADDLAAWRALRPVAAKPVSRWWRLRMWARREPVLAVMAAGVLISLVLSIAMLVSREQALGDRTEALRAERAASALAGERLALYDRMSDAHVARELLREEEDLWPRRSTRVAAMEAWLERAGDLLAERGRHQDVLAALRASSRPLLGPDDLRRDERMRREAEPDLWFEIERREAWLLDGRYWRDRVANYLEQLNEAGPPPNEEERARREMLANAVAQDDRTNAKEEKAIAALRLDPRVADRRYYPFEAPEEGWRHAVQTRLVADLDRLSPLVVSVEQRLKRARTMRMESVDRVAAEWKRCLAAIARDPLYGENQGLEPAARKLLKELEPIEGLVPLGRDLTSGLWEFWHVGSGPRPPWVAHDGDRGRVVLPADDNALAFGIVLVLIPGGPSVSGVIDGDLDPQAGQHGDRVQGRAPYSETLLDPYLISKFEMTQHQWAHTGFSNDSDHQDWDKCSHGVGPGHPVTDLGHGTARMACARLGLVLPTEAQWEHAARGGTRTAFWSGASTADVMQAKAGNVCDETAHAIDEAKYHAYLAGHDDGHEVHAPVGQFAPNAFGLHDTIGNVREWCEDLLGYHHIPVRPGDGLRQPDGERRRIVKGGSFMTSIWSARSAYREALIPEHVDEHTGLRPALELRRRYASR